MTGSGRYVLLGPSGRYRSDRAGRFAGIATTRIFGRLTCAAGMRARREHRVFFATWEDAVACGYRACKRCRPVADGS